VNDVLDHLQQKSAAATTYTKQDLTCNDQKESDLKDGVNILEDGFEMMAYEKGRQ
jgi:hypothetical protein